MTKKCFVIAPIGKEGSHIRKRSDQIWDHVVLPALTECGYEYERADKIKASGIINQQIIDHLVHDDLVIADLTGLNPNVVYELGIRHAVGKPVIHIKATRQDLPFDISVVRVINVDYRFVESMNACKKEIVHYIKNMEAHPEQVHSAFDVMLALKAFSKDEAQSKLINQVLTELQNLRIEVGKLNPTSVEKKETHFFDQNEALADWAYEKYIEEHGYPPGEGPEEIPPDQTDEEAPQENEIPPDEIEDEAPPEEER